MQFRLKVLLISNALLPPYDEGIRKFAWSVEKALSKLDIDLKVINPLGIMGKTLASLSLWKEVQTFKPQVIIYLPTASATVASFVRISLLKALAKSAVTVLIALQPRSLSSLAKRFVPFLTPHCLLVQNPSLFVIFRNLGMNTDIIYSGVDTSLFTPIGSKTQKSILRAKYGLPEDKRIVVHVGHISPYRNVDWIASLHENLDCIPVVVGSTSTARVSKSFTLGDQDMIIKNLQKCGVLVLDSYIESIWEVYQAADCYVFPVKSEDGSIGIPLSVLEAMACNLPVVTTPFGGLPSMFSEGDGLFYVEKENEFLQRVRQALSLQPDQIKTREKVLPYSWENVARMILEKVEKLCSTI
jgi:glycosyltransferase involved in cell wall biosynthesis